LKVAISKRGPLPGKQDGSFVEISIQDSGKGIPDEIQGRIFEPFFSTKEEGIGLGLPIAQRLVQDHNGEMRVESSSGRGTTFTIILPVQAGGRAKE
jgi:signal transduction histidine kinase